MPCLSSAALTLPQLSPLFQLQATFASLERSKLAVFDPVKLIESLQLRASEQQDAQEYVCCQGTRAALISVQVFETIYVAVRQRISNTRGSGIENLPHRPSMLQLSIAVSYGTYEYSSKGIRFTVLSVMVVSTALRDKPTFWN